MKNSSSDPLEERLVRVGSEVEDACVQVEPGELPVEERPGVCVDLQALGGRHGRTSIPETW
jgi:hypothetical protein